MLTGILGIGGFVLVIGVIGSIMAEDGRATMKWGAALTVCVIAILTMTQPRPYRTATNCYIDWDGRANPEVCD